MSVIGWIRLSTLTLLGNHPRTFLNVARFGSGVRTLVSTETGLCIEAPPRSGNSFFVTGFSMANPDVVLAHHHHVPAQVLAAMRLGVPIVTLLRNPIDSALARAAPSDEPFMIGTTLARFVSFWERLQSHLNEFLVIRFEDLISNPTGAIELLNKKYGTAFATDFPDTGRVFAEMNRNRLAMGGPDIAARPNPNIPDGRIAVKEAVLRPQAEKHRLAQRALKLYDEMLNRSTRL